MRDILIVSIVAVAAVLALRRPWVGVMLWTWLSLMNPHRFSWGFAFSAPLAAIAAAVTVAGLLATRERQSPFQGVPVLFFAAFAIWMTLSWSMGMDPQGDYEQWTKIIKIYFMTFVSLALLQTKQHLIAFAWINAASLALLGAKGGAFTILTGGNFRVWGPPGTFIQDNNEFALSLIVTIPLLHFLQLQVQGRWLRHTISIAMLLCAVAALGTHSRGGLLAIMAMGGMFWWRSRHKGLTAVLIAVIALAALPMMPEAWWQRMHTISEYQEDGSAMGRINAWYVAWQVAQHHVFGGGMTYQYQYFFSLYGLHETIVRAAHSIYFQILGNHGFMGLFLYLGIWITTYWYAGWLRRHARAFKEAKWAADLGAMAQVSLVGFAVGGAFLSLAYFDLLYNIMVLVVLARRWVLRRAWEHEPQLSFREALGLGGRRRQLAAGRAEPAELKA